MSHFKIPAILLVILSFSACTAESKIEGVVETLSRSMIEGNYSDYINLTGGAILKAAVLNPVFKRRLIRKSENYLIRGIALVDVYIKRINVNKYNKTAYVSFLEKYRRRRRVWTLNRLWNLEYIDGSWRVVRFIR